MNTLTVKVVGGIKSDAVCAMMTLGIEGNLDFESGDAQYDFAELTDDEGNVVWSTDGKASSEARRFFDEMYS